jgi:hypothetical protein
LLGIHCTNQWPAGYRFQRRPEVGKETLAARRSLLGEAPRVVRGVVQVALASIE